MKHIGRIAALHRYPVKSMRGETLESATVGDSGLRWDRGHAIYDLIERRAASAKNTERFPGLLDFSARYMSDPDAAPAPPPVEITFPDGRAARSDDPDCVERLSSWFDRPTSISAVTSETRPAAGRYALQGTFFDYAALHLLTDVSLSSLAERTPHSSIALERFRPNVLIECVSGEAFPENAWTGRTIHLGDEVSAKVTDPCPRCAMPTFSQADLPKDGRLLKAIAQANTLYAPVLESDQPCLGSYAFIMSGGVLRRGDHVWIG